MRRSLSASLPVQLKVAGCPQKHTAIITVPNNGTVCYISHDRNRLLLNSGGTQEGSPLTSTSGDGGGPRNVIKDWEGDMWALGSVEGMPIDVE